MKYDVAVIGAGVVGSLITRELSKYNIKVALLERCNDCAMGATKANSAIVHAGFDAVPGTLKARLNVRGVELMKKVCKELNVPLKNNEALVVAFSEEEIPHLEMLKDRGEQNGVSGLRIVRREELVELEPNIGDTAVGALVAPTSSIVCPYELTIAGVENAVTNGAEFLRNCEVTAIDYVDDEFKLTTSLGEITAEYVINAAGVHSGEIASLIGDNSIEIVVRHGDYYLLDKSQGSLVSRTIFQCPTKMGKGVLVSPTVDGNLIVGPSAEDIDNGDDVATTSFGLDKIYTNAIKSVPAVSLRNAITSFSGNRAHPTSDDFIIGSSDVNKKFINAAGIESPGLSSAPAIAEMVDSIINEISGGFEKKADFNPVRPEPVRFRHMTTEERAKLIEKNKAYGRIVCRCETITEGEILDAIHAPAGARDVDGVKRRTRAGMGRCQGGFCGSKVVEILARELNVPMNEITKFGGQSKIMYHKTK
ncbi:MAG: NAD(P)/FAD-dependent oxidoreductase [Ruminococcaceae bacterium]|nr:NAD(P)/FAD-dependent oxidoreductase [Oscillospiraceae bacterium]